MKLALFSDLHLEMDFDHWDRWEPPDLDADLILLVGDIGLFPHSLDWASQTFQAWSDRIAFVAGNHEYYGNRLLDPPDELRSKYLKAGVHFLERDVLEHPGVRILGCTLWSGFDLHGKEQTDAAMVTAQRHLNDYRLIRTENEQPLHPSETQQLHDLSVQWLDKELAKPFEGKTVVLTHFAPHRNCVPECFKGSPLSPYFVTDLAWLMEKHRIDFWCYGHTHSNIEFVAGNGCRVVSNQRGYPHEQCEGFQSGRIIEL